MMMLILYNVFKHAYYHNSNTETQFYKFLVVICCISFGMHLAPSLLKYKIFIIKIETYLLLHICSKMFSSSGDAL